MWTLISSVWSRLFAANSSFRSFCHILDFRAGYAPDILKNSTMAEHSYELKYELYALAMQRWFDSLGIKNARLGGAIYFFAEESIARRMMRTG